MGLVELRLTSVVTHLNLQCEGESFESSPTFTEKTGHDQVQDI